MGCEGKFCSALPHCCGQLNRSIKGTYQPRNTWKKLNNLQLMNEASILSPWNHCSIFSGVPFMWMILNFPNGHCCVSTSFIPPMHQSHSLLPTNRKGVGSCFCSAPWRFLFTKQTSECNSFSTRGSIFTPPLPPTWQGLDGKCLVLSVGHKWHESATAACATFQRGRWWLDRLRDRPVHTKAVVVGVGAFECSKLNGVTPLPPLERNNWGHWLVTRNSTFLNWHLKTTRRSRSATSSGAVSWPQVTWKCNSSLHHFSKGTLMARPHILLIKSPLQTLLHVFKPSHSWCRFIQTMWQQLMFFGTRWVVTYVSFSGHTRKPSAQVIGSFTVKMVLHQACCKAAETWATYQREPGTIVVTKTNLQAVLHSGSPKIQGQNGSSQLQFINYCILGRGSEKVALFLAQLKTKPCYALTLTAKEGSTNTAWLGVRLIRSICVNKPLL